MDNEIYNSLRSRKMLDILDGDTGFGIIKIASTVNVPIQMPYLTGKDISRISEKFGYTIYNRSNLGNRKTMLDELITYCILNEKSEDLLNYLLSESQFQGVLAYVDEDNKDAAYQTLIEEILKQINSALRFSNCEILEQNGKFILTGAGTAPKKTVLNTISRDTIRDFYTRANNDIENGDYQSAISKSRTLVENVCCYVIEKAGQAPANSKEPAELYQQIQDLYQLDQEPLVHNLNDVVNALSETGTVTAEPMARLYMNAAILVSDYILSLITK